MYFILCVWEGAGGNGGGVQYHIPYICTPVCCKNKSDHTTEDPEIT